MDGGPLTVFRRGAVATVAALVLGCGGPRSVAPVAPQGKTLFQATGGVGTQSTTVEAVGGVLRFVFETSNSDGASVLVRVMPTNGRGQMLRPVQGTFHPDEPAVETLIVQPGEYKLTIEATGDYRMRVEEP